MMDQTDYPGAEDYLKVYARNHSVSEYLRLIEDAKKKPGYPLCQHKIAFQPANGLILQETLNRQVLMHLS
jgi:hypothetical protein